ncbi:hypothetical protein [Nitrosomonas sp. Nm34]|uniref:hypothetical protein n=1 Tax=Nitrosomonas sp. Nm34 TaxID=1881055 RepID=UPI000B86698E|nr:hypothetical protein [Nitrosomonas sp. Nm34]
MKLLPIISNADAAILSLKRKLDDALKSLGAIDHRQFKRTIAEMKLSGDFERLRDIPSLKSKQTLPALPCRIIYTVCGSPSRHV